MAEVNITMKLRLSEVITVAHALTSLRETKVRHSRLIHVTDEERSEMIATSLACENILRQLGADIPPIEFENEEVVAQDA